MITRFNRVEVARLVEQNLPALHSLLSDRVSVSPLVREHHSLGEGVPDSALPDVVVFPETNEEVAAIVQLAGESQIPLIPFGAGTSLEGHVVALYGGITVDLSRMDRILQTSPEALDCRVQAGVRRQSLNTALRSTGVFFPIDPGADASIGGMCATRASGTAAVRYGTMRENVLGLTVVTGDGQVVRTGTRARKSATGYDLTRLFVGSEGTLGIITEVQLRLHAIPDRTVAAVCQFPTVQAAMEVVIAALYADVPLARIELLNHMQMRMSIRYSDLRDLAELPTLFFEFQGTGPSVDEQIATVEGFAREAGGSAFQWATRPEERARLWTARHMGYYANLAYLPGKRVMSTDACVPISEIACCIAETEQDIVDSGMIAALTGHVGDGNFHLGILFDPDDASERARAEALAYRTGERAIRLGGTCSGEHGIGMHKLDLAALEHGEAVDIMWRIKRALDPAGIMNPGKLLPSLINSTSADDAA